MNRVIGKIRKKITVVGCSHPRVSYIGKNKKAVKQFQCTRCGLKGSSSMVSKQQYVYKVGGR